VAVLPDAKRDEIDAAVAEWRDNYLLGDGSLLWDDELWREENVEALYRVFNQAPITTTDHDFDEKWEEQIGGDETVSRLAAEILGIHVLFASDLSPARKRELVSNTPAFTDKTFDANTALYRAMAHDRGRVLTRLDRSPGPPRASRRTARPGPARRLASEPPDPGQCGLTS